MRETLDYLRADQRVIQAARIAREFKLDPVTLLRDEGDEFLMLVRLAATQVVLADKQKEAEASKPKRGRS